MGWLTDTVQMDAPGNGLLCGSNSHLCCADLVSVLLQHVQRGGNVGLDFHVIQNLRV